MTSPLSSPSPWHLVGRRLLAPFALGERESRHLTSVVALVRVLFGLIVIHQMIDILGLAAVAAGGMGSRLIAVAVAGLGAMLAVGFLTPIAILGLVLHFGPNPLVFNLGTMVSVTLLWGLLLLGAGRSHSVDAWLLRSPAGRWFGWLHALGDTGDRWHVARVRLLMLILFWGNCVTAMLYHIKDSFWLDGHVLQFALTAPYLSDHYPVTRAFQQAQPALFNLVCRVGLGVQAAWELLLVPLMYFRWTRVFVVLQGLAFFTISLVFMNLMYLPVIELLLWLLLFGPAAAGWLAAKRRPSGRFEPPLAEAVSAPKPFAARVSPVVLPLAAGVMVLQIALAGPLVPERYAGRSESIRQVLVPLFRTFGQRRVNVFNQTDIAMADSHLVLHEVDAAGRHLRVAPFQDISGGRLDYLRNDMVYFSHSLHWQRAAWRDKFVGGDPARPAPSTIELARRFAALDALVTGPDRPRHYVARVFVRSMRLDTAPPRWSKARQTASFAVDVTPEDLAAQRAWPSFDLPPGQAFGMERLQRTDEALRHMPAHTALPARP